MGEGRLIGPSADAIREAARLAEELEDIATQAQLIRWSSAGAEKTGELLSQSDRLVIVAARCGRIRELLRCRYELPEE